MITGEKVILRTLKHEDLEAYHQLDNNLAERGKFWPSHLTSFAQLEKEFKEDGLWDKDDCWLLITDLTGYIIGSIGYFSNGAYVNGYEIGFHIFETQHRGKGYMTDALKIMSDYLFQNFETPRLQVMMDVDNIGCQKVAEKCHYQYEGTMRKCAFNRGEHRDYKMYSLLREECEKMPGLKGT